MMACWIVGVFAFWVLGWDLGIFNRCGYVIVFMEIFGWLIL